MDDLYRYADETVDLLENALASARRVLDLARQPRDPLTPAEQAEATRLLTDVVTNARDVIVAADAAQDELDDTEETKEPVHTGG
jgi:hypothetical protein